MYTSAVQNFKDKIPVDPDFYLSQILDPTTTKEEGKQICCLTFFVATNFTLIVKDFIFKQVQKKIERINKNCITFSQKISTKLSEYGRRIQNPVSGKKHIPDPGVKKTPDPGSGSATLHIAMVLSSDIPNK